MNNKSFSTRLKSLRQEKQITGEQLGKHLNVTKTAVSYWENGKNFPGEDMLVKIATFFGVSIDYLLGNSNIRSYEQEKELFNQFKEALEELGMYNKDGLEKLKLAIKLVDAIKKDEKN